MEWGRSPDSLFIGNGLYDTIDSNFYIDQISQNSVLDNFVWNGTEFIQDGTQPYIGSLNNLSDQNILDSLNCW